MMIRVDAEHSHSIAAWINRNFTYFQSQSVDSLGLQLADDRVIFDSARQAKAVLMKVW